MMKYILILAAALSIPAPALAECPDDGDCSEEEQSSSVGAETEKERINGIWIGGTVAFSTVYVLTIALTGALAEDSVRGQAIGYAFIPIAGPFVAIGNDNDDVIFDEYRVPLILSGVFQILSVATIAVGLFVKRDVKPELSLGDKRDIRLSVLPYYAGGDGFGVGLALTHR